jgi:hypothetical protein
MTLKGPQGRVETVRARNRADLDKIKVGDTIEITDAQAVAISVEKRKSATIECSLSRTTRIARGGMSTPV